MRSDPDAEQMTPEERSRYEQEVLREMREQFDTAERGGHERLKIRETRLEGAYPDTAAAITYWDPLHGDEERTTRYRLWLDAPGRPASLAYNGHRESPYTVAMLIVTYVYGG